MLMQDSLDPDEVKSEWDPPLRAGNAYQAQLSAHRTSNSC